MNPFSEDKYVSKRPITWEQKAEMIRLANMGESGKSDFEKYVLDHVSLFDQQAWDMFVNAVQINIKDIQAPTDFWAKMKPFIMRLNADAPEIGLRTSLRCALIQKELGQLS